MIALRSKKPSIRPSRERREHEGDAMADVATQFVELNGALKRENYAKAVEICNKSASRVLVLLMNCVLPSLGRCVLVERTTHTRDTPSLFS